MELAHTRRMVAAAIAGELHEARYHVDPVFGFEIPDHVKGVPDEVLRPRQTWEHPEEYDLQAATLAGMFRENFEKFESEVSEAVAAAGP